MHSTSTGIMSDASHTPNSDSNSYANSPLASPLPVPDQAATPATPATPAETAETARLRSRSHTRTKPRQARRPDHDGHDPPLTTSLAQNAAGPSPCGGGPASKRHTIPPRPKPGRKPAQDEPQTKRKAQNRKSQQDFRARNKAKFEELALAAESARQAHRDEVAQMTIQMNDLRSQIRRLEEINLGIMADRDFYKHAYEGQARQHDGHDANANPAIFTSQPPSHFAPMTLTMAARDGDDFADSASHLCGRCRPDGCECLDEKLALDDAQDPPFIEAVPLPLRNGTTPMQDVQSQAPKAEDPSELEIDFTTYRPVPSREEVDFTIDGEHQSCGFCTRPDNCLCRDESLRSSSTGAPLSTVTSATSVSSLSIPPKGTPGSCAACLADPEQQKRCQGLAAQLNSPTTMEPRFEPSVDKLAQKSSTIPGIRSVGCSEAFGLLDGRVSMDMDSPEWRQLRPLQSTHPETRRDTLMSMEPSMEPGTFSAMEVDVGSILTTLQHSGRPLKPRPSDGRLATIVEKAEELRQATNSPCTQAQHQSQEVSMSDFNMDTRP
ncbi:hypothetical protein JI435_155360 [Parastagonospora nodorum SN15]|uniref:Hap4 transcription factor heteromerisation domain-containing protein n=1 Tax=Phaeosphaeria nodorum (strain SN15 / ATCC MYA-4574 / FGSC 10173) TaxID=321614 RepID=A0A7U2NP36_PHANO|nr:hypothetical protein JI435_155360 [Parastagonospora nodorum SN15]